MVIGELGREQLVELKGLRLGDGRLVESDGRLGQDAAVERGAGLEDAAGRDNEDALEVRGGSGFDGAGRLPEDVVGLGATLENDTSGGGREDAAAGLEDEDVRVGSGEEKLATERDVGVPRVHARREGLAGEEAVHEVGVNLIISVGGSRATSRVGVGSLHVADGGRHNGRRRRLVVGRVAAARHLRRRRGKGVG